MQTEKAAAWICSEESLQKVRFYVEKSIHPGDIIFPGQIAKEFGIDMVEIYPALEKCADEYRLTSILALFCEQCRRPTLGFCDSVFDIPSGKVVCPVCGKEIEDPAVDAIVVYRRKNRYDRKREHAGLKPGVFVVKTIQ